MSSQVSDNEKGGIEDTEARAYSPGVDKVPYGSGGAVGATLREEEIVHKYGRAQTLFRKLFALGVEARGVERVPEDERSDRNSLNSLFLWFSVNTVLTTGTTFFFDALG